MCKDCNQTRLSPEFEYLLEENKESKFPAYTEGDRRYSSTKKNVTTTGKYRSPFFSWLSKYDSELGNYVASSQEKSIIKSAIDKGERNENVLSDAVFFKRHPELGGRPLYKGQSGFDSLSQEWLRIRDELVRPMLGQVSSPSVGQPNKPSNGQRPATSNRTVTLQKILMAMRKKRYAINEKPFQLNIVGLRSSNRDANKFDDTINLFYKDNSGNWQFRSCKATTDPGTDYLNKPINGQTGTAIVKPGQYPDSHQRGIHHGTSSQYLALVQRGNLTIYRDGNLDNHLDLKAGTEVTANSFGINIHRALSSGTATTVGTFSAGCQVFANTDDFNYMMSTSEKHAGLYGNNFTYTLMNEKDITVGNAAASGNKPGSSSPVQSWPSKLVDMAMVEYNRWGKGTLKETSPEARKILVEYWTKGGLNEPSLINEYWCGAFVSWVVWKATGGTTAFKYSGANAVYAEAARNNRLQNNTNPFKAYRVSEIRPQKGDILVRNGEASGTLTYDNIVTPNPGTHAEIVTGTTGEKTTFISGNSSDTVESGSTRTNGGYLTDARYFAIIRIGGASPSEIRNIQKEYELDSEWMINPLFESVM